jgi:hypothetical protein
MISAVPFLALNKKIYIFCPILLKLGEYDQHIEVLIFTKFHVDWINIVDFFNKEPIMEQLIPSFI